MHLLWRVNEGAEDWISRQVVKLASRKDACACLL